MSGWLPAWRAQFLDIENGLLLNRPAGMNVDRIMSHRTLMLMALAVACGGQPLSSLPAKTADSAGFIPAPHDPLPALERGQGRVLQAPRLVTVTFAGYELQAEAEAFGSFLAGSQWLRTIGAEYGVGAGSSTAIRLSDKPPPTLDANSLNALLAARIADGTLPPPDGNTLYVVYTSTLTWFLQQGGLICPGGSGHVQGVGATAQGTPFPWIVGADCFGDLDDLVLDVSLAVADAVTDPFLDSYRLPVPAPASAPQQLGAGAACLGTAPAAEGSYKLARSYSSQAASAGKNPCLPVVAGEVFYSVSASPALVQEAAAGSTVTVDLTGWSDAAIDSWVLIPSAAATDFDPQMALDRVTMTNGGHATATFTVPATAQPGQVGLMALFSAPFESQVVLGVVVR
jgi:hypothetical protein